MNDSLFTSALTRQAHTHAPLVVLYDSEMDMERIASNLQTLMQRAGIGGSHELARALGNRVSQPTISRLLGGVTKRPSLVTMTQLAEFFGVSVQQLAGGAPLPPVTRSTQARQDTSGYSAGPVNVEALTACIAGTQAELVRRGVAASPRKFARLVALAYTHFVGGNQAVDERVLKRFVDVLLTED